MQQTNGTASTHQRNAARRRTARESIARTGRWTRGFTLLSGSRLGIPMAGLRLCSPSRFRPYTAIDYYLGVAVCNMKIVSDHSDSIACFCGDTHDLRCINVASVPRSATTSGCVASHVAQRRMRFDVCSQRIGPIIGGCHGRIRYREWSSATRASINFRRCGLKQGLK